MLSMLLFVLYLGVLAYLLFFSEAYGRTVNRSEYQYNLTLFREIKRFFQYRELLGTRVVLVNIVGNVVAFVPFGIFLPLLSCRMRNLFLVLLATFGFSVVIEALQLIYKVGTFDVDDLFLNTLGGAVGYLLFCVQGYRRKRAAGIK